MGHRSGKMQSVLIFMVFCANALVFRVRGPLTAGELGDRDLPFLPPALKASREVQNFLASRCDHANPGTHPAFPAASR